MIMRQSRSQGFSPPRIAWAGKALGTRLIMGIKSTITKTCLGQKQLPRDGNLTFTRCPGVGNLTLAFVKMSNSPGSCHPPPPPWSLRGCPCKNRPIDFRPKTEFKLQIFRVRQLVHMINKNGNNLAFNAILQYFWWQFQRTVQNRLNRSVSSQI